MKIEMPSARWNVSVPEQILAELKQSIVCLPTTVLARAAALRLGIRVENVIAGYRFGNNLAGRRRFHALFCN